MIAFWGSAATASFEIRRLRRLIWLLIPLFILIIPLSGLTQQPPSDLALLWIELPIFAIALFVLLAIVLQFVRLSPELKARRIRVIVGGLIALLMMLLRLRGEWQFLVYFFLGVWIFSFQEGAGISGKEKLKLTLSCLLAMLLLAMIWPEYSPEFQQDARATTENLAPPVELFRHLSSLSPILIGGLRRLILALVIILPGKVLLHPLADWLRLSLRIRIKLLLSYILSGIIPGLLLVVLLFFGILFMLGGYYQRFITELIASKADGMSLLLDQDATASAARLKARSVTAVWYDVAADSQVHFAYQIGAPLGAVPQTDSIVISLGEQRFSGLAVAGDSVYLTQWLKAGNQVVGLLQPFGYEDLVQLESQFGMDLVALPGESVTFGAAGRHGMVTQIETRASSRMIRSDTAPGMEPEKGLAGLPVLLPCIRYGQDGIIERGDMLFVVQLSVRSFFGNLFSKEYVINRVYLIAFVILTAILGAILVLVALMGFGLAGGITGSIGKLSKGTQRLRQGDLSVQIQVESKDELGELANSFNLMVADLNRMLIGVKEKERLEGELEAARSIQMKLLPQQIPKLRGYEIAAASLSAKQVGGDYYDFLPLTGQRLGFAVGDVSGKGMPAALLMANLQASLHTLIESQRNPSELVCGLNRVLHANTDPQMFATFFFGVLDAESGKLRYVNAGHNSPIICGDGRLERLSAGGLPLGILPETDYAEGRINLNPGELIVLYSDGITEAMNAQEQEFSEERLIRLLQNNCRQPVELILQAVLTEVESFAGAPQDDVTMVLIKRI